MPACIVMLDLSGKGLWKFWNDSPRNTADKKLTMKASPYLTPDMINQAFFHTFIGTAYEDLGALEHMTGVKFLQRKDFGNSFSCGDEPREGHALEIIRCHSVAKLTSTSTTQFLTGSSGSSMANRIFAFRDRVQLTCIEEVEKIMTEPTAGIGFCWARSSVEDFPCSN